MDKATLINICISSIATITSIIVAVLTYKNLKEFKLSRIEESRAYIVFYIDKKKSEDIHSLIIKNFGKSGGKLIDISITPKLDITKISPDYDSTVADIKNIFLAPGQYIKSNFDFRYYPDKKFSVIVNYECMGKVYAESYIIDLSYARSVLNPKQEYKNELDVLAHINKSIQEISDRLG